jgi:hypothetical protein
MPDRRISLPRPPPERLAHGLEPRVVSLEHPLQRFGVQVVLETALTRLVPHAHERHPVGERSRR